MSITKHLEQKSTPGVNFINIIRAQFSYKSAFLKLRFGKKALLFEKCERKMLMKLTPESELETHFVYFVYSSFAFA